MTNIDNVEYVIQAKDKELYIRRGGDDLYRVQDAETGEFYSIGLPSYQRALSFIEWKFGV